jgi:hypothetical protein
VKKAAPKAEDAAGAALAMMPLPRDDWARIREILKLTDAPNESQDPKDRYSINTRHEIEYTRALADLEHVKSQRPAAIRARLQRIERAARALVKVIDALPPDAPEAGLLLSLMREANGLDGVRAQADELAHYSGELRGNIPKVGHKPEQSWKLGHIRGLARHFQNRTGRKPASTPGHPFGELVTLVLRVDEPAKLIRKALAAPSPASTGMPPPDYVVQTYVPRNRRKAR